jgi:hypothetical protein
MKENKDDTVGEVVVDTDNPEEAITFGSLSPTPPVSTAPTFTEGQMEAIQATLLEAVLAQPEVFACLLTDI